MPNCSTILGDGLSDTLNVVCLKWGNKYPAEYANRLFRMVARHLTRPHVFYCLTEDATGLDPGIVPLALERSPGLTGWWYKLSLFRSDFYGLQGNILYLDLDLVIVDNIDFTADMPGDFLVIRNWSRNLMWNSSVMRFKAGKYGQIWQRFCESPEAVMSRCNGDQEWIFHCVPEAGNWPGNKIVSYKKSLDSKAFPLLEKFGAARLGLKAPMWMDTRLPEGAAIVVFHGKPDPDDVASRPYGLWKRASFVERHWR